MNGIAQLLNLCLVWLFFGFLTSFLAKKQGKNPRTWFFVGLFLGILGVALVLILPRLQPLFQPKRAPSPQPEDKTIEVKVELLGKEDPLAPWYYLTPTRVQIGPLDLPELASKLKNGELQDNSYLWSEGMAEWKRLSDLPDLRSKLI